MWIWEYNTHNHVVQRNSDILRLTLRCTQIMKLVVVLIDQKTDRLFSNSLINYLQLSLPRYYNSTSNYITMLNSGASIILNLLTHLYIVGTPKHQLYFELISVLNCGNYWLSITHRDLLLLPYWCCSLLQEIVRKLNI